MSDLISRKGVSAWLYNMGHEKLSEYILDEKRFPSADRPTGKWSEVDTFYNTAICTNCLKVTMFERWGSKIIKKYNFCPNCGAKMEGDTE